MAAQLTTRNLDRLQTLLAMPNVVVLFDSDVYTVKMNAHPIATHRDLLAVVDEAWGVLCAHAAVQGERRPKTLREEFDTWRKYGYGRY